MSSENPTKTEVGMQEASTQKAMEEQVVIEKAAFKQVTDGVEQAKKVQTLGNIAQATDTQAASNDLKKLDTVFPETKRDGYSAPNANENAVTAVKDAIAKDTTKPGDKPIDFQQTIKAFAAKFPTLSAFFTDIAKIFTKLANNTDTGAKAETAKLDSPENKKIFDKYGIKTDKNVLDFGKATVDRKSRNANQDSVDLRDEKLKDGKLTIDPNNTKSVTTKEDNGKVTVTVIDNNDASNIYTVSNLSTTQAVGGVDRLVTNAVPVEKIKSSEA